MFRELSLALHCTPNDVADMTLAQIFTVWLDGKDPRQEQDVEQEEFAKLARQKADWTERNGLEA